MRESRSWKLWLAGGIGVLALVALGGLFGGAPVGVGDDAPAAETVAVGQRDGPQPTSVPDPTRAPLLEYEFRCTTDSRIGFAYTEGLVTNVAGFRLENVEAVTNWYAEDGTFITSDSALIEYEPLLPDQTSPFKVIARYNPAMQGGKCSIAFKELFGGTLPARRAE